MANYCRCSVCGEWGARGFCNCCSRRIHAYCGRYRTFRPFKYPNGVLVPKARGLVCDGCASAMDLKRKPAAKKEKSDMKKAYDFSKGVRGKYAK